MIRNCELCNGSAAVFCPSDAAFLCWSCDSKVHEANFLVARHVRQAICVNCDNFAGDAISVAGAGAGGFCQFPVTCESCGATEDLHCDSDSDCISSTTKEYSGGRSAREVTSKSSVNYCKAEGVLVNWSARLGLEENADVDVDVAVQTALRACLEVRSRVVLPFRVLLAASMWLGLKSALKPTSRVLKRLEEVSGVAAKIILVAESKIARDLKAERREARLRLQLEEGWAEC